MKFSITFFALFSTVFSIMAQEENKSTLPYHQIPDSPEDYSSGNVLGRMIDGLGYRFYWATEGLRDKDLVYKPNEDGRSIEETITHIYGLSLTIVNAHGRIPNIRPDGWADFSFEKKRELTLKNLMKASELLKVSSKSDIEEYKIIFQNGDRKSEFPYWNMINGPIADAIYHTGQVVVMRRSAGNPIHPGVSVFIGKTRE